MNDVLRPGRSTWLYVCWHRSDRDGLDHAVTDEEFSRGRSEDTHGQYAALCGHVVLTGSMLDPPGLSCPLCLSYWTLAACSTLPTLEQQIQPTQHRWLSRWHQLFSRSRMQPDPERHDRPLLPAGTGSARTAPVPGGRHVLRGVR